MTDQVEGQSAFSEPLEKIWLCCLQIDTLLIKFSFFSLTKIERPRAGSDVKAQRSPAEGLWRLQGIIPHSRRTDVFNIPIAKLNTDTVSLLLFQNSKFHGFEVGAISRQLLKIALTFGAANSDIISLCKPILLAPK